MSWLLAFSEWAGKEAGAFQIRFAAARLNDIEPAEWLKDFFKNYPLT